MSYGFIHKRIVAIVERFAVPRAASTCVDAIDDARCRYVAEWDGQARVFGVSMRSSPE